MNKSNLTNINGKHDLTLRVQDWFGGSNAPYNRGEQGSQHEG